MRWHTSFTADAFGTSQRVHAHAAPVGRFASDQADLVDLPERLRCGHDVAYRPELRELVLQLELPTVQDVVSEFREVKYTKERSGLRYVRRTKVDASSIYSTLIAQMTLVVLDHLL